MGCPLHPNSPRHGKHPCRSCYRAAWHAAHRSEQIVAMRDYYHARREEVIEGHRVYRNQPEVRARIARAKRWLRHNALCLCACGRPVLRTGLRRSLWCSDSCRSASIWAVCDALRRGGLRVNG